MTSSMDTSEDLNLDNETIFSVQFKSLFDDDTARYSSDTSDEIIHALSKLHWLPSPYHLSHQIVSLVYDRLTKFVEKLILTGHALSNDEIILMNECLDFIIRIFESAYTTSFGNEEEDNDTNDDISTPDEIVLSTLEKLCQDIVPLNDLFLKLIQSAGWKIMKNHLEIMSKIVSFLLRRHKINMIQLQFSKNVDSSLERFTEENQRLFDTFVECINSSDGTYDYLEAINQLDSKLLDERSKFLLFDSFNFIISNDLYTEDFRTKFCRDFWLFKYKQILKEVLPNIIEQINKTSLPLNAIKYLITNLIQMQRKAGSNSMFSKGQIENFALKDEYLPIIMMLLPWFSNSYILKNLMESNDDLEEKIFQLNKNYLNNTKDNVTIAFVTWTILKLILMFINANGDCLAYIKYDQSVKEILLKLLSQIKERTSIKIPFAQEMQIGISIMLAYSVFSLRLSEDVPSQSDSVHLISLYLTICMFFSLSAMTWFAIANKLREKKRLPYWLRWLALDYICWIVCATSMHRKAVHTAAKQQSKISTMTPSTPITIPLQPLITTNSIENSNKSYSQQISLPSKITHHTQTDNIQCMNEIKTTPKLWIRRTLSNTQSTILNGSENRKHMTHIIKKSHQIKNSSLTKIQESLYAIHIINRLVFFMFLFIVIVINIYTWFIYSRTVQTKLFDNQTIWTCFDESRLEVINCNETF
ncbi:unnamed protein product [Rotaria sp. Silwood1]|nr:unnamed protein product [Rotaria sp. Silwood1]